MGQVSFTTSDRLSLLQMTLFCLFPFTRGCVSLIAHGWRCLVFLSYLFHFCLVLLGVVVCLVRVGDLVLCESSGTGLCVCVCICVCVCVVCM